MFVCPSWRMEDDKVWMICLSYLKIDYVVFLPASLRGMGAVVVALPVSYRKLRLELALGIYFCQNLIVWHPFGLKIVQISLTL